MSTKLYKVGDILRVRLEYALGICGEYEGHDASTNFIKITSIDEKQYHYDILDSEGENTGQYCYDCFRDEHLEYANKTNTSSKPKMVVVTEEQVRWTDDSDVFYSNKGIKMAGVQYTQEEWTKLVARVKLTDKRYKRYLK